MNQSVEDVVAQQLLAYRSSEDNTTTCFQISFKSNTGCLDWRQICNGLIDCEEGEDEESCELLERNTCHDKDEYRCKNGLCIPISFSFDSVYDCLDRSDEALSVANIVLFFVGKTNRHVSKIQV